MKFSEVTKSHKEKKSLEVTKIIEVEKNVNENYKNSKIQKYLDKDQKSVGAPPSTFRRSTNSLNSSFIP